MPTKVKVPKGEIGPQFTKRVLPWIETFWHTNKRYPSDTDLITQFGFTLLELEKIHASKFFKQSLERRGISHPNRAHGLTDKQMAAIAVVTNYIDRRPTDAKLAAIGVTAEMYNGWMQDSEFKRQLQSRADEITDNVYPEAQAALARKVSEGEVQAIKFYYELTGRANTPETINLKLTLLKIQEAIERNVKDPRVLQAIGQDIAAALAAPVAAVPTTPIPALSAPSMGEKSMAEKLSQFHQEVSTNAD
jgi:hypothetical protein